MPDDFSNGSRKPMNSPDLWQYSIRRNGPGLSLKNCNFSIELGPGLPFHVISRVDGSDAGYIIGFPIDIENRKTLEGTVNFLYDEDTDYSIEQFLKRIAGRFIAVIDLPGFCRVYPDASAQVPCVIDQERGTVGSTAHALFSDLEYDARFRRDAFKALGVDREGWFPAGLTAHRGLVRLLPNHFLNLDSLETKRFWPSSNSVMSPDPERSINVVVNEVRAQIEALLAGPKRIALALTGGHETRMLLACARPYVDELDLTTVVGPDRHSTDTIIARRIVKTMGLRHLELPRLRSTPEQKALFIRRGGDCNADSNSEFHPSVWPIAETHVFVGGLGGEVGRAFLWSESDSSDTVIDAHALCKRFGLPVHPELCKKIEEWLEYLPDGLDSLTMLDLAYHENRNGPWYAAQFCSDPTLVRHAPLLTRTIVEEMMSLPAPWKRSSRLGTAIIEKEWPELSQFPYNSLGRLRDLQVKILRILDNPGLILKKLRKLAA